MDPTGDSAPPPRRRFGASLATATREAGAVRRRPWSWPRVGAAALSLVLVPAGLLAAVAPPAAALMTQDPLVVHASATNVYLGTTVDLSATGGSGTGVLYFQVPEALQEPQCLFSGSTLQTGGDPTTCDIQAVKPGDGQYDTAYSAPITITFTQRTQAPLVVTSTTGTFGTPLTLTASGGSTDAPVKFSAKDGTASGCTVGGTGPDQLTSTTAGTCIVTATKAGSGIIAPYYADVSSDPATVTLVSANQLVVTSTSGLSGQPLTLTTMGGSGTGEVTYTVVDGSAINCTVSTTTPYTLSGSGGGTCIVTATKAGDATSSPVTSAPTAVTLLVPQSSGLSIAGTNWNPAYPMPLATAGGNGGGAVTYQVDPGSGCVLSPASPYTLSNPTGSNVCFVTATKASDGTWAAASSPSTMIQFSDMPVVTTTSLKAGYPTDLPIVGGAPRDVSTVSDAGGDCSVVPSWGGGYQAIGSTPGGVCLLRITQNDYNLPTISWPTIAVPILRSAQAPLVLTSATGSAGSPLPLTTSGGSGDGRVTYAAADGTATGCTISLTLPYTLSATAAGTCSVTATKAGAMDYEPASSAPTTVTLAKADQPPLAKQATSLTLKQDAPFLAGSDVTLSATLVDGSGTGLAGRQVTLAVGTGADRRTCTATTTTDGVGTCTVTTGAALGPQTVEASFTEDADHLGSTATGSAVGYALSDRGTFVIGDKAAVQGGRVTFWSSSWSTANPLTGGTAPTKFKGFASKVTASGWSTGNGPSGNPPASVPVYLLVDVTGAVNQAGSTFSGGILRTAVVRVDAGYGAKNNQTGTGTVVALLG